MARSWFLVQGAVLVCVRLTSATQISLTSIPAPLNGIFCPGDPIVLTCNATALPTLAWYNEDGSEITKFIPTEDITSPFPLRSNLSGVEIFLISAMQVAPRSDNFNMISILCGNTSSIRRYFNRATIHCGTIQTRDSVIVPVSITEKAPPPNPSFIPQTCSLTSSTHGTAFSLSWNPDPQNSADLYRIQVSPEPSSACPHEVRPGQSYNCSGLNLGQQYTVTVNASNCNETQQSITAFNVQLKVDDRLTTTNIGLIATGTLLWLFVIIINLIILYIEHRKGSFPIQKVVAIFTVPVLLMVLSLILWIFISVYIGIQRDTCDSSWQSNRNVLIIISFILSLISLLLSVTFLLIFLILWQRWSIEKELRDENIIRHFNQANKCYKCSEKLTSLFDKYRCHVCKNVFCKKCSTRTASFLGLGRLTVHCDMCSGSIVSKETKMEQPKQDSGLNEVEEELQEQSLVNEGNQINRWSEQVRVEKSHTVQISLQKIGQ